MSDDPDEDSYCMFCGAELTGEELDTGCCSDEECSRQFEDEN